MMSVVEFGADKSGAFGGEGGPAQSMPPFLLVTNGIVHTN